MEWYCYDQNGGLIINITRNRKLLVAADWDGTFLSGCGNQPPLRTLWQKICQKCPGIVLTKIPERIDNNSFAAIISALEEANFKYSFLREISGEFPLRNGARDLFRAIGAAEGELVILTVNPFGADWVQLFLPQEMPKYRIIATSPVWEAGALTGFENIITPLSKIVPRDFPGIAGKEIILIGDATIDREIIDRLNNASNPLVAAVGFCRLEEREVFFKAGFDTLLPLDAPMSPIVDFIKLRYL